MVRRESYAEPLVKKTDSYSDRKTNPEFLTPIKCENPFCGRYIFLTASSILLQYLGSIGSNKPQDSEPLRNISS